MQARLLDAVVNAAADADAAAGWVPFASWFTAFIVWLAVYSIPSLLFPLAGSGINSPPMGLLGLLRHYPLNSPITRSKWRFIPGVAFAGSPLRCINSA